MAKCENNSKEQLSACHREKTVHDLLSQIPNIYYKDVKEPIIVDKCRSWTITANIELLQKYITEDYKIIILERPVTEIVKSFAKLYSQNHQRVDINKLLLPQSEPIMRSIGGISRAKIEAKKGDSHYLFISYEELVNNTKETISKIYDFCGWEPFKHDFKNIVVKYPEDDTVYGLKGQHKIRKTVGKQQNTITLSEEIIQKCKLIDTLLGYHYSP
jgi:ribosomal protein S18